MSEGIWVYLHYINVSFRGQMQYRVSFVLQSVSQFVVNIVEFVAIWALLERFNTIAGWSLPEVALLYGLVNVSFALTDAVSRGFDVFGSAVRNGTFDRILLRPRTTFLQLAGQELTLKRIGRFLQGAAVLGWALAVLPIDWTLARAIFLVFAIVSGVAFFYGLLIFQATLCFWTTETVEIMNVFTYGGLQTAQYPMTIYGRRFRRLFTYGVPLACVTYFPALVILGRTDPLGFPLWFAGFAPCLGFVFFALSLLVWQFGIHHYRSTGS